MIHLSSNAPAGPWSTAARAIPPRGTRRDRLAGACLPVLLALFAFAGVPVRAQTVRPDFYITNGQITAQVLRGSTLYVGGSFSFVGPVTGAGVPVDATTGVGAPGFPRVNGTVMAAVPDGSGGWFIGGQFTSVGTDLRANLAHVLADHSVSPWNPGASAIVRTMLLSSGVLYVGGDFLTLGGSGRNRIGAIDAASGAITSWNPNANGSVRALAAGPSALYVGGQFTTIGGQARNRIAALDTGTGAADPAWNPNANSLVLALAYEPTGNRLYVGGQFTSIDGSTRNRVAALDAASGFATAWNPGANNQVFAILASGSTVYVGGQFTVVGGQTRNRIAALDATTALATAWDPNAGNLVQTLALSGSTLYAGGDFLTIGGQSRSRIAALSTASGLATAWNPSAFNTVSVLVANGSEVFAGGSFNGIGGVARNNLAAFDVGSGQVTGWNPNANNLVQALVVTPDVAYVGGNFTQIGGAIRNNAAAIDLTNGLATAWDPNVDGQVSALALAGGRIYLGGLFSFVGGQAHMNLAAVSATTGQVDPWSADADNQVLTIDASTPTVYVGGNFTTVGSSVRSFLAALDPVTGAPTAWAPEANGTVRVISPTCDRVYVGGFFTSIGGQPRNRLATVNLMNGQAMVWDPGANGPVFTLLPAPGVVYVGGVLSMVGLTSRNRVAAIDPTTGAVTPWNPNSNGTVRSIVADDDNVFLGGVFSSMNGQPSGNLAVLSPDNTTPCPILSLPPPPLAAGVTGTAYSTSFAASGGSSPYCYALASGALPAGLSLDGSTGQLSGTPLAAGIAVFAVTATDVRGCTGTANYTLTVTAAPAVNSVTPVTAGLCLNPAAPSVTVPFELARGDATPLRGVSVTFQIDTAKLKLANAGPASLSIQPGTWAVAFPNRSVLVTDLGAGRYTVDAVLLGAPCGATAGGSLFTVELAAQGPTGTGAVTVTSVTARDCANGAVAVSAGPAGSVNVSNSTITLTPSALPDAATGVAYSQTLGASGGSAPWTFTLASGALPAGLSLSSAGVLSGTPVQGGVFSFTVRASEPAGCSGTRDYVLTVTCPAIAVQPVFLPDGAAGTAYSATLTASAGLAPFTFAVTAGALPDGLTLSSAGVLSGTPTAAGTGVFTIGVTDAANCTGSRNYTVDVFSAPPVSDVAAQTAGLAISTSHPCVSVPFVFTRGESSAARGVTVSFQIDAGKLALCAPPATAIQRGSWFSGFGNTLLQVTDDGGGAYTVDATLIGTPCGISTSGVLFTVDLQSVGPDGSGAITVTRVKARDCGNTPIAVAPGAAAALRIQNTPIVLSPTNVPNATVGSPYSQAITAGSGVAPFAFSVTAGALPPGLTLSGAGLLAGTPSTVGSYAFTVQVADADDVRGTRAYTMSVACPVIALSPPTLPDAQLGVPYAQSIAAAGGSAPYGFTVTSGELPPGLSLSTSGELTGTPTGAGVVVFSVSAADAFGCTGSEVYTLPVFLDPAISRIVPRTAGLCLSANRTCVSVPFVYQRGENAPAMAAHVRFQLDPRFALCTPGSPAGSIHAGSWLSAYANQTMQIVDNGGGSYTVDQTLLGLPCGPDSGGVLFTVDVASVAGDGAGDITVTECRVKDCANQPLPAQPGPPAQLVVSHTPPPAIEDLLATQELTGNGANGRTGIRLTWTNPQPGTVALYRAPFGSYPEYDDGGGAAPDSALAPTGWTLCSASAVSGSVDLPPARGSWHYVAFLTDSCGNRSAVSNMTRGALDYHLGDVSDGVTRGAGNNRVGLEDVSLLGAHYGISGTALVTGNVAYLDVGPTVDGLPTSRPATDDVIDLEDLMVFSLNFQAVSSPQASVRPASPPAASAGKGESFELEAPALVQAGEEVTAVLHLAAGGGMQGFSAELAYDAGVLEPVAVESGGFAESQGGVLFSPRPCVADAALLGVRGGGFAGSGEVARFRFRVKREGDTGLRLKGVVARDAANHPLAPEGLARALVAAVPAHTLLLAPSPNPARGAATLAFALAQPGAAELAIFSVDGRRVRTLAHGGREAGSYRITWKGDDDGGRGQGPGIYWARLTAGGQTFTRRIVFLR